MGKKLAIYAILIAALLVGLSCGGSESSESGVKDAVNTLLEYEKYKQWDKVWDIVHPDCQALFNNEDEFIAQMDTAMVSIKDYTVDSIEIIPQWACKTTIYNVCTGKTYSDVAEIRFTATILTTQGEVEDSSTMHGARVNGEWKFFYGPINSDGDQETTTEGDFELGEWTIVDDNSRASLRINFTTTKDVSLYLNDPDGLEVGSDYISGGTATASELYMAGYEEVPKAGEYTLIVKDIWDDTISTSSFDFQGADAVISEIATTWTYYSYSDDYNLDTLSFKITNSGDLPVYISKGSITVGSKQDDFYVFDACVLPNENKIFSPSAWVNEVTPGEKSFTLELKDGANVVVCSYSSTVTPAE